MPVLHAVAMETMRLYPIAGLLPRTAARDFGFAGYTIRRGEPFLVATCATHFSPRFFPDPGRFDIGRFAEPRNEHKVRGVYAPFGAGPHTCLGAGLAEVQIVLTAATLLNAVDLAFDPPGYRLKKAYTPSLSPKGLSVKFTRWRREETT
jgi:cytochrome P450